MKFVLASSNKHKWREFSALFPKHELILTADLGLDADVEETGTSFLENALIKAQFIHSKTSDLPVMADDSGICAVALNGAPGIYSNRYGSEPGGMPLKPEKRNKMLLNELSSFQGDERKAYFVCCLVIIFQQEKFYSIQETLWGKISHEPAGTNGFGYDPIFYLPEYQCTMAEIEPEVKNSISHRAKAVKKMRLLLD